MSSTNKTTNYNLSQFIGSDKPAWLLDYNQDMSKIDTGIKSAADAAEVADGKADSNTNNIGNLANLNTQAKTNIVASINEVYNTAGTAEGTASQAANAANSAKTEADALTNYFAITKKGQINATASGATISSNMNNMNYALNEAGTLGKVYGRIRLTANTTGVITLTLPVPALTTPESFNIAAMCYCTAIRVQSDYSIHFINSIDATVNANGNIVIEFPSGIAVGTQLTVWFPPCLYFFTDFGDIVTPSN